MKKLFRILLSALAGVMALACAKVDADKFPGKGFNPFSDDAKDISSYYSYAEVSVPVGTQTLYVKYVGKSGEPRIVEVPVSPQVKAPVGNKDVEPFGTVKLLLQSSAATKVSVFYYAGDISQLATKAGEERVEEVYALQDFPLDQVTSGEFGQTRYVRVNWNFAYENNAETNWQNEPTYPKDVVVYDTQHNHTLRYKFAYSGMGFAAAYFLEDAYTIEDYVVTGVKYNYCNTCGSCPYCMPWGCSCSCGGVNPNFVPNGDTSNGQVGDGTGAVTTDEHGTIIADFAPHDATQVFLPEPAKYVTSDEDQIFYHSSGVVMFEDSWPNATTTGAYDSDFDDVVIDYDFEAKVMPERIVGSRDEQVKVVLHVRSVGSNIPYRVGVKMEGFDQQYVERVEQFCSLDSWQNPHGELPNFIFITLGRITADNPSLINTQYYLDDPQNPVLEIGKLQAMNETRAGQGEDAEYTYVNGDFTNKTVFNLTYGYKERDKSQYDIELESIPNPAKTSQKYWSVVANQKYYNCIPGYINVSGGLFTYTVIFHMKDRSLMDPVESEKAKENMLEAVMNTVAQNFYIVNKDYTPIGLKGYDPVFPVTSYETAFNKKMASTSLVSADNPYAGPNGQVWGFKCPTLTKHVWNKLYFSQAYPHYQEWLESNGAMHSDWYYTDVDGRYLSCWW